MNNTKKYLILKFYKNIAPLKKKGDEHAWYTLHRLYKIQNRFVCNQ